MISNRTKNAINKLLEECGINYITEIPLELLIAGRGIILRYSDLKAADGRIVFGENGLAVVTINSKIEYEGKRRFTILHELGHFEMHKDSPIHNDSDLTLNSFIDNTQESEANQFAVELLLPEIPFKLECSGNKFSPNLVRYIAEKFNSSLTSVIFRYLDLGNHPIFVFFSENNRVRYWKHSEGYYQKVKDITRLAPPEDSVAAEYYNEGTIYPKEDSIQRISKSTWFELNDFDTDSEFFEYCIITPKFNTVLSIVWEN